MSRWWVGRHPRYGLSRHRGCARGRIDRSRPQFPCGRSRSSRRSSASGADGGHATSWSAGATASCERRRCITCSGAVGSSRIRPPVAWNTRWRSPLRRRPADLTDAQGAERPTSSSRVSTSSSVASGTSAFNGTRYSARLVAPHRPKGVGPCGRPRAGPTRGRWGSVRDRGDRDPLVLGVPAGLGWRAGTLKPVRSEADQSVMSARLAENVGTRAPSSSCRHPAGGTS
jgi:hypothetical protein